MGVPSDMHTETNMRESHNTKMNILTGIKMNTFSTPNRAKFLNNMQHFNVQCDHISRRFELGIQYGNTSQSLIFRTNI